MKKVSILLLSGIICFTSSCSKKSGNDNNGGGTVSRRILNITINGHTYHDTSLGSSTSIYGGPGNYGLDLNDTTNINTYGATINFSTSHLFGRFEGTKLDVSSMNGTYKIGRYYSTTYKDTVIYGVVNMTDIADGHKLYSCVADTTSSYFTLSNVSASGFDGVFSFTLLSDTVTYPVTGDFKFTY